MDDYQGEEMNEIQIRPHLLTLQQVAIILQVHIRTIRRYMEEGKLIGHNPNGKGIRGLRVTVESLKKYLREYELDEFNDVELEDKIQVITQPQKNQKRKPGWVRSW